MLSYSNFNLRHLTQRKTLLGWYWVFDHLNNEEMIMCYVWIDRICFLIEGKSCVSGCIGALEWIGCIQTLGAYDG